MEKTHLSIAELAQQWGVSPSHIRRLIWNRELKAVRIGKLVKVSIEEVRLYLKRNELGDPSTLGTRTRNDPFQRAD